MGTVLRIRYTATNPETGEKETRTTRTWYIRYSRAGRRHTESSHSTKKGDAQRLLAIREGDKAKGLPVSAAIGRLRFDEAAADVVNDYKTNGNRTAAQVERRIRLRLDPFFGARRMASITTADVRAYTAQRQAEGAENATINLELAVLKRAFRLAEQAGTLLHRPHIPLLRLNNVRQGFFERDEFEDVREALPPEIRGVATFAYLTGWRVPSEVLTLEWRQVDREAQTVTLDAGATKNGEARTFPYDLLPELADVIEAQWTERQRLAGSGVLCSRVFHRNGKPIKSFRKAWTSACAAAGVPGRLVHDFRRTAVRNLVRAGVPDTVAMKLTGHKTRSVFDRYNISSGADLREAVGKLADAGGKERGKIVVSGRVRAFRGNAANA